MDKNNKDLNMSKIIGIIAFSLVSSYSLAQQKRPLDVEACTSWNRIDNPQISPTGRYVTYKIVPVKIAIRKQYDSYCSL